MCVHLNYLPKVFPKDSQRLVFLTNTSFSARPILIVTHREILVVEEEISTDALKDMAESSI